MAANGLGRSGLSALGLHRTSLLSFARIRQLSLDAPPDTGFMLRALLSGTINVTPGIKIELVL